MDIMQKVREYNFLKSELLFIENIIFNTEKSLIDFSVNYDKNLQFFLELDAKCIIEDNNLDIELSAVVKSIANNYSETQYRKFISENVSDYFHRNKLQNPCYSIPSIENWIMEMETYREKMDDIQTEIDEFYEELNATLFI